MNQSQRIMSEFGDTRRIAGPGKTKVSKDGLEVGKVYTKGSDYVLVQKIDKGGRASGIAHQSGFKPGQANKVSIGNRDGGWKEVSPDKVPPEVRKLLKLKEGSVHEVILKQRDRDILEELIDKHGLEGVVETIAEIAFEKEEHIEQGDDGATSLSKSWGKDAKALDTLSARLAN